MKRTTLLNTIWIIVEAALILVLGILTMVFAKKVDSWNAIGVVAGVLVLIDGLLYAVLFTLTRSVNNSKRTIYRGVAEVTLGIFLLIRPEIVVIYFTLLVAIALVVSGVVCLIECGMVLYRKAMERFQLIMSFIASGVILALGITALVFYPYNFSDAGGTNTISVMLLGGGALFCALSVLIVIMTLLRVHKMAKLDQQNRAEIAKERSEARHRK